MVLHPIVDTSCRAFEQIEGAPTTTLLRFVVGEDPAPRPMMSEEIGGELGDPFGQLLLSKGVFPATAEELLAGLDAAVPGGDPLRRQRSFFLGEESQVLPIDVRSEPARRGHRGCRSGLLPSRSSRRRGRFLLPAPPSSMSRSRPRDALLVASTSVIRTMAERVGSVK